MELVPSGCRVRQKAKSQPSEVSKPGDSTEQVLPSPSCPPCAQAVARRQLFDQEAALGLWTRRPWYSPLFCSSEPKGTQITSAPDTLQSPHSYKTFKALHIPPTGSRQMSQFKDSLLSHKTSLSVYKDTKIQTPNFRIRLLCSFFYVLF